jgi:hypothetical protein
MLLSDSIAPYRKIGTRSASFEAALRAAPQDEA